MAHATNNVSEIMLPGSTRAKIYTMSSDGTTTTVTIAPGMGYGRAMGAFKSYTIVSAATGGTFHFSLTAAPTRKIFTIMFLK